MQQCGSECKSRGLLRKQRNAEHEKDKHREEMCNVGNYYPYQSFQSIIIVRNPELSDC